MKVFELPLVGFLWALLPTARGFSARVGFRQSNHVEGVALTKCWASDGDSDLDSMRAKLEASWGMDAMGKVPSNPASAAEEAAEAIRSAERSNIPLFLITLALPGYSISEGPKMYDEVMAVDYCIALSKALSTRSRIFVRGEETVRLVNRVLRRRDDQAPAQVDAVEKAPPMEQDDVAKGGTDEGLETNLSDESQDFRDKLRASWEKDNDTAETPVTPSSPRTPMFKLSSLFGDDQIPKGGDMMNAVVQSVRSNALPILESEETLILLSASQPDEIVAVRTLVSKFKGSKRIILINFESQPLPRELDEAETVYYLKPMVAKAVVSDVDLFGDAREVEKENQRPIKVVLLRRYPADWEVYVDPNGEGFEFAGRQSPFDVPRTGPSIDWVGLTAKRFLQDR